MHRHLLPRKSGFVCKIINFSLATQAALWCFSYQFGLLSSARLIELLLNALQHTSVPSFALFFLLS